MHEKLGGEWSRTFGLAHVYVDQSDAGSAPAVPKGPVPPLLASFFQLFSHPTLQIFWLHTSLHHRLPRITTMIKPGVVLAIPHPSSLVDPCWQGDRTVPFGLAFSMFPHVPQQADTRAGHESTDGAYSARRESWSTTPHPFTYSRSQAIRQFKKGHSSFLLTQNLTWVNLNKGVRGGCMLICMNEGEAFTLPSQ